MLGKATITLHQQMEGFAALPQRERRRARKRDLSPPTEHGEGEEGAEGAEAGDAEGREGVRSSSSGGVHMEPGAKRSVVEVVASARGKPISAAEFAELQEEERRAAAAIADEFHYECTWRG